MTTPEQMKVNHRRWYNTHKEYLAEYQRDWRIKNKKHFLAKKKEYNKTYRDKLK